MHFAVSKRFYSILSSECVCVCVVQMQFQLDMSDGERRLSGVDLCMGLRNYKMIPW